MRRFKLLVETAPEVLTSGHLGALSTDQAQSRGHGRNRGRILREGEGGGRCHGRERCCDGLRQGVSASLPSQRRAAFHSGTVCFRQIPAGTFLNLYHIVAVV